MIVQTECRVYEGTAAHEDGSWTFNWTDEDGIKHSYTYEKDMVDHYVSMGAWKVVEPAAVTDNYAAAFNMWMDEYINSPQDFEDSYSTALKHVSEKLLGEEPSYGAVAAEQFKQYLNKVEQLALENQNV